MKFLLDENLSYRLCGALKSAGHDAVHVKDVTGSVIISCDHDFVQLLFESGDNQPSLILTRNIETLRSGELGALLVDALSPELEMLLAAGAIAACDRDRVRVRPLPLRPSLDQRL